MLLDEGEVRRELESDEVVLWTGRPDAAAAGRSGFGIYIFAAPWTVFSLFWTWGASAALRSHTQPDGMDWGFPAFGLPFLLIGFAMLSSPYWMAQDAKRTIYAVTDRVLVLKVGKKRKVQSYFRIAIAELERTERADGSGTLTFVRQAYRDGDGDWQTRKEQFVGISRVREVEQLIRKTFT